MDRVNGAGWIDIGGGRRGYRDENLGAGVEGTEVPALWLNMVQEEIMKVCAEAGLSPSDADWTQLYQAIGIMLDALFADVEAAYPFASTAEAIAGLLVDKIISPKTLADVLAGLLSSPARLALLHNPVFPEVETPTGRFALTTAAASVSVDAGQTFIHRGVFKYSTSDYLSAARTFATVANKTYHLRWSPGGGFALKDLANAGYNPGTLPEADLSFDSSYDDMLIARVVTNGANVATIASLANKQTLQIISVKTTYTENSTNYPAATPIEVNFARTPNVHLTAANLELLSTDSEQVTMWGNGETQNNRYTASPFVFGTRNAGFYMNGKHTATIRA